MKREVSKMPEAGSDSNPKGVPLPQTESLSVVSPPGLVSVVLPCCGQLEYTKLCVPGLLYRSRKPFELIFLDIGSLDGTAEFLAGVAAAAAVRVEVVRTITDLGIPAACRDALSRARGEFVVLLNNDTLVTDSWLDQLTALANLSPSLGLIGPMSNYADPPQAVEAVPYRIRTHKRPPAADSGTNAPLDMEPLHQFAKEWREQHRGKWLEVDRLGGFCLLIKRRVLEQIGPLDTLTGLEVFDTAALCRKARQAGYTMAVCRDLFIHNFGSRASVHGGPAAP